MITITVTDVNPDRYAASAVIDGRERYCSGKSKHVVVGYLAQAFPDVFSLGSVQRAIPPEDLGKIILRKPEAFNVVIRDTSR